MGKIIREEGVGVVVDSFDPTAIAQGALQLASLARDPAIRARCVTTAEKYFSLTAGTASYDRIYRQLDTRKSD